MSYNQYPNRDQVSLQIGSQHLSLDISETSHNCPPQIKTFLVEGCGWEENSTDPNTYEPLFVKNSEGAANYMYYRWYEAVAYEFWKFIAINSGNDVA